MKNRNMGIRIITSIILVALVAIALILPTIAHAMFTTVSNGFTDGSASGNTITRGGSTTVVGTNSNGQLTVTTVDPNNNGYTVTTTTYNSNGQPVSQTTTTASKGQTFTTTNTYTTQTITKTYTQYIYDTYEVDHYIYEYMYPIIKWVFTLTNIGQLQAPGYHNVGNEKLFLPGYGSGGIFVPVFAQEAIYIFNIAPSTKPQITGWYTGSTSQSTSGPYLVSQSSSPPQLTGIQDALNTIQNQSSYTVPNITKTTTYWNYITQPSPTGTGSPPNNTSPQPTTNPESWITFWKAGPGGVGGTTVTNYGPGGVKVTYKPPVFGSPPSLPPITLPPGLLPPGVNSPPPDKFIHNSGALAGVPINGAPPSIPISGLGGVLSGVGNAILNGVENGLKWLHL